MSGISSLQPATPRKHSWQMRWFGPEARVAWLFILPSLIGFTVFYAVPAVRGLLISFTNWDMLTTPKFVGVDNYTKLLSDPAFWDSLGKTVIYVLLNIPLQTILAVSLASLIDRVTKSSLIRAIFVMPWLLPPVTVALIWLWMLDPTLGFVNNVLRTLSRPTLSFLGSPDQAMPSIALINIWQYTGYTSLLFFAGLQTIPKEVYEAGAIDGASRDPHVLVNHNPSAPPSAGFCVGHVHHRLVPDIRHDCRHHQRRPHQCDPSDYLVHL